MAGAAAELKTLGSKLSRVLLTSRGVGKKLYRTPRLKVRFGRIFQSSWAYHSKLAKWRSGTISRADWVKELACPRRKLAKPGLPPSALKLKLPLVGLTAFSVLRIHWAVKPNRKEWLPLIQETLS